MRRRIESCGLTVDVETTSAAWMQIVERALGDVPEAVRVATDKGRPLASDTPEPGGPAHVLVGVESSNLPFPTSGLPTLTRGAWGDGRRVVLADAAGSGLDLLIEPFPEALRVTARPRPRPSHRALRLAAPGRTELLWRAALLQYPILWWAGTTGAVPLHVSAARIGNHDVVLAGPGGVGKSTLLGGVTPGDGAPVSDNLCTYDGDLLHGLPEPRRVDAGAVALLRPRMPHGRVEQPWENRLGAIRPSLLLVLRRGTGDRPMVQPVSREAAERALVTGTYAAGELRRYWAFAATLALGTGLGPAHPPIGAQAAQLAASSPCFEVVLPGRPVASLAQIVELVERVDSTAATPHTAADPAVGTRMTGVQG